ncbi:unnamed protein product, partial [Ixodes hexagonus]
LAAVVADPSLQLVGEKVKERLLEYQNEYNGLLGEDNQFRSLADNAEEIEQLPAIMGKTLLDAAVTVLNCPKTQNAYSVVKKELPKTFLISIMDRYCPRMEETFALGFPVISDPLDVVPLLVDLRNKDDMSHWKSVVILHDPDFRGDYVEDIVKALRGPGARAKRAVITTYRVCLQTPCEAGTVHVEKIVQTFSEKLHVRHFVIVGNLSLVRTVLFNVSAKQHRASL